MSFFWFVFVRQDAAGGVKSLSDFPSDIVTRSAEALGVVAASAGCCSPVFTALDKSSLSGVLGG